MRDLKRSGLLGIFTKAAWRRSYQEWSPLSLILAKKGQHFSISTTFSQKAWKMRWPKHLKGKSLLTNFYQKVRTLLFKCLRDPSVQKGLVSQAIFPYQAGIWFTCPFQTPWECQGRLQTIPSEYG